MILLMAEILHQFIGSLSHYLQGFIHPRWLGMGFLNHQPRIGWMRGVRSTYDKASEKLVEFCWFLLWLLKKADTLPETESAVYILKSMVGSWKMTFPFWDGQSKKNVLKWGFCC